MLMYHILFAGNYRNNVIVVAKIHMSHIQAEAEGYAPLKLRIKTKFQVLVESTSSSFS